MNNDLISREALRAEVIKILDNSIGGAYDGAYQCFVAINNAPAIDVVKAFNIIARGKSKDGMLLGGFEDEI